MLTEKIKLSIRVIISFLVIVSLIYFVGIEKLFESITKIKIEYFVLVLTLFIFSMFLITMAVLSITKTRRFYELFKFKTISWSTGMFLPGKIGEMSFPFLLKKLNIPTKKAFAIFLIDRFVSFSIIGFFSVLAIVKYSKINIDWNYLIIFIIIFAVMLAIKNKIKKFDTVKKIFLFLNEIESYLKTEKKAIFVNYFFSFINFVLMFWITQIIFSSIGVKVSLIDVALISSLALFIGLIPITINGLGIREGTLVYLYSLVGIEPEYSILVAFVFLISSYFMATLFLALYWSEFSFILKRKSGKTNG